MGIRTAQQFLDGLRDDREVYYRGERVAVITNHLELRAR
jgi:aromatic ring hydroxylase